VGLGEQIKSFLLH